MSISSQQPYGNTSPGGVTPPTPSCHSTPSMRQRSQIYRVRVRGRRCRSCPAMASHLTIIGPEAVEKKIEVLVVIEVSLEAEGEDPL